MITFESFNGFPEKYFTNHTLIGWLSACAAQKNIQIERLAYKFCDEQTMLSYNQKFLQHDYYTDILTFPEKKIAASIAGDILINVDRLKENAVRLNQEIENELLRLLAHGLLHLCGYNDETEEEKRIMREAEDSCIELFKEV